MCSTRSGSISFLPTKRARRRPKKPSLSRAYRQFPPAPAAAMSEPVTADWGKGPVVWLMSDGEKAAWAKLKGDPERVAFVAAFWRAREAGNDDAFRAIFERRVAFADAELGQQDKSGERGSMTDRGMVFILLGPPAYSKEVELTSSRPVSISDKAAGSRITASGNDAPGMNAKGGPDSHAELWHYRKGLLANGTSYPEVTVQFWLMPGHRPDVLSRKNEQVNAILNAAKKPA